MLPDVNLEERAMTPDSNDSQSNDADARKTAMLIFRDEGVD
jgi:hypothetical protein